MDIDYSKKKVAVSIEKNILEKIDLIKSFPRWKGNRSEVIEDSLRDFLERGIQKDTACIFCNVKDSELKGNYWIIQDIHQGKGVCSKCTLNLMQKGGDIDGKETKQKAHKG